MATKKCWGFIIFCLSVIVSYQVGKLFGENSAEFKLREEELAFQKKKEATRKAEFAKLLRIDKERWNEKRRDARRVRSDKMEQDSFDATRKRNEKQERLNMKLIENLMKGLQYQPRTHESISPLLFDELTKGSGQKEELEQAKPATSQWEVFETTTIDGWVKKIKRGTIFKTTSGNIYEVAEAVFLFEMKLQPKVTVLTNGQIYKLLFEGMDEQLLCKKLSPGNKGTKAYINRGEHHWISENIDSGTFIKLEDDSLWEVSPIDKIYSMLWLSTSPITVIEGKNPLYPYLLINTDDGEQVEAKLLSD